MDFGYYREQIFETTATRRKIGNVFVPTLSIIEYHSEEFEVRNMANSSATDEEQWIRSRFVRSSKNHLGRFLSRELEVPGGLIYQSPPELVTR